MTELVAFAAALALAVCGSSRPAPRTLTKQEVRAVVHPLVPRLTRCYQAAHALDPTLDGVVNPMLTVTSDATRTTIAVRGYDTAGRLGESAEFRACATAALEGAIIPPIAGGGRAELIYPVTFGTGPVDNHDTRAVDAARAAATAARWPDALAHAETALRDVSLDGTYRRPMIQLAGIAACHLGDADKARHYASLVSPELEADLRAACTTAGVAL